MKSLMSCNLRKIGRARGVALVLVVLTLPLFLGAWKIVMSHDINPAYVERIQDGKTKKHEILTLFGDPEEIDRTPEGIVYIYKSFRDKETLPKRGRTVKSTPQDSPYFTEDWQKNKSARKVSDKEVASMLIIHFDRDGETVRSHEYKQF